MEWEISQIKKVVQSESRWSECHCSPRISLEDLECKENVDLVWYRRAVGSQSHLKVKETCLGHCILHGEIGQGVNRLQGCGIGKAKVVVLIVYLTVM